MMLLVSEIQTKSMASKRNFNKYLGNRNNKALNAKIEMRMTNSVKK